MKDLGKKKVGFIFDEAPLQGQSLDMLQRLGAIDGLEITLIQNVFPGSNHFGLKRKIAEYGVVSFVNKAFFAFCSAMEERVVKRDKSRDPVPFSLADQKIIEITPLPSRRNLFYRYTDADLDRIRVHNFDLLVRGDGRGIVKGDILGIAKDGFLSLHYGDNRVFRGVPAGYWEVYYNHPETGYIIQLLNEVLDGGHVIARGAGPTIRPYTRNWHAVYSRAHDRFQLLMQEYGESGYLPPVEDDNGELGKLLFTPNIAQSLNYIKSLFT